jgi:hypothetical protein
MICSAAEREIPPEKDSLAALELSLSKTSIRETANILT